MPSFFTKGVTRMRLIVLLLTITWLALASLSSATARFAIVLRGHAKPDFITTNRAILGISFRRLMDNVLEYMVIVAVISALFSIFGIVLLVYPRLLREDRNARVYYGCIQVVLSLAVLCFGGYTASRIHGSRSTFEFFDRDSFFSYYTIIYYGAIGEATFGGILIIVTLVHVFAAG